MIVDTAAAIDAYEAGVLTGLVGLPAVGLLLLLIGLRRRQATGTGLAGAATTLPRKRRGTWLIVIGWILIGYGALGIMLRVVNAAAVH